MKLFFTILFLGSFIIGSAQPGTYYLNITTRNKTEIVPFVKE